MEELTEIVGKVIVSEGVLVLRQYSHDPSSFPTTQFGIVVKSSSTQVSRIVGLCNVYKNRVGLFNETRTPTLPFGSGYLFAFYATGEGH